MDTQKQTDQELFSTTDPMSHQKIVKGFLITAIAIASPFLLVIFAGIGLVCLLLALLWINAFLNPH
jgi:hypothetical protein